jgi:hypothetical protein
MTYTSGEGVITVVTHTSHHLLEITIRAHVPPASVMPAHRYHAPPTNTL